MPKHLNDPLLAEIEGWSEHIAGFGPIQPGNSLSIKTGWQNGFGEVELVLLVSQAIGPNPHWPKPEEWSILRLDPLLKLLGFAHLNPVDLPELMSNARAVFSSPMPPATALLHAALPSRYVCFDQPPGLLAGFCASEPMTRLAGLLPPSTVILPFEPDLHRQAKVVAKTYLISGALVLLNRGVLTGADTFAACRRLLEGVSQAVKRDLAAPAEANTAEPGLDAEPSLVAGAELPRLRAEICAQRGRPLVLQLDDSPATQAFIETQACTPLTAGGAPTPALFEWTRAMTLVEKEVESLSKLPEESGCGATIVLKPGLGAVIAADSSRDTQQANQALQTTFQAVSSAVRAGEYAPPSREALETAAAWESIPPVEQPPFAGEVALVTGSAVGIGKAIVESFLRRGCAVAGLDISPSIATTFDHPAYLGLCCDVADEAAVCRAIRTVARRFGGLDILALNAGLFPGGCNIEKLSLAEFTRVINVNFIANLVIMREAFPLLKLAPRYGRVVIIGSKNMRAPGPGAAAYSTSKAALSQLARVAALEWGCERVRVNIIHPDAVFDTALYTEEVLSARAAHYGMTVEQYKKRNLLKTEIKSHDVAELAAEMCGPLFEHMTGGQLQLDGGNDRTI
jgi:NAD(P)-dependent dehydrogenase (short-subunit alcohol dehydrogenase family)/rhamnose utilization protein RhaD (predicted bifunctional aldolase and dehydrogenase)